MAQNNSSHKVVIKINITGQQNLKVRSGSSHNMIPSLPKSKVLKINRYIEKLRNFSLYKGDGESKNFHLSPLMASFEVITRACQLELQFFTLRESWEFFIKQRKPWKTACHSMIEPPCIIIKYGCRCHQIPQGHMRGKKLLPLVCINYRAAKAWLGDRTTSALFTKNVEWQMEVWEVWDSCFICLLC